MRLLYHLLTTFATGLLLAACESQPAASTHQPATALPIASSAAAISKRLPSDTLAQRAPTLAERGDVHALHEPYREVRTIAPGLQLLITSVPAADTTILREPSDLWLILTIKRRNQVIFCDTVRDGFAYTEYSEPATAKLYPIWLPTGPSAGQLLVAYNNRPSRDQARRFFIHGSRVVKIDTLPAFYGPATDVDHDGRLEYGGLKDYGEEWDDEQGRHRQTYNPTRYYEIRPTGLVLDSALTRRKALAQYGAFYGYQYSERPIILKK